MNACYQKKTRKAAKARKRPRPTRPLCGAGLVKAHTPSVAGLFSGWDGGPTFPWHPVPRVGQPRASIGPLTGTHYNRNANNLDGEQVSTI